jgi:oxidase EvaA
VIIEIPEGEDVEVQEDFRWLTLGELMELLRIDNIVNMDSRTVLSCVRFGTAGGWKPGSSRNFSDDVMLSASSDEGLEENDFDTIVSWITQLKIDYRLEVRRVPLKDIEGWTRDDFEIRHQSGRFFSIIAVAVTASAREVAAWQQPLIRSVKGGVLAFVCQRRRDVQHFLVQGRVEPGNLDAVEMAPTLQCTPANYDADRPDLLPPFYDLVTKATPDRIRYDSVQSEEGGRFYHDQNRYLVIEIPPDASIDLPSNFIWMTLRQMKDFVRLNNYFNIEARGLISCLPAI